MNATDAMVQVRITTDGTCFIDDEFFVPPPGTSLNEAVLSHLQLEAAALDAPSAPSSMMSRLITPWLSRSTGTAPANRSRTTRPRHRGLRRWTPR